MNTETAGPVQAAPASPPTRGTRGTRGATSAARTALPGWLRRPLTAILAVQTALALSLIWSNAAFGDEADYLWMGHQVIAHWLHGTSWPRDYGQSRMSGSPILYPPLGAMADAVGGLAAARLLSLVFMLGATWLLYGTAARLFDRRTATFAAALWMLTEPVLRLAFATYDPLSVALTALSAWLIAKLATSERRGELVALGGIALAFANACAYSGIAIDPVVLAFAVVVWQPRLGWRRALTCAGWLIFAWAWCFIVVMYLSGSFSGLLHTIIFRTSPDHQSMLLIVGDVWGYSGLVMVLALVGAVFSLSSGSAGTAPAGRRVLLAMLALTAFVVPLAQLHAQTGWSLDKHVAYGLWFAAMAAGYAVRTAMGAGLGKVAGPDATRQARRAVAGAAVVALAYPAYSAWQAAWVSFHAWASAQSYVAAIAPLAARTPGPIFADDTYFAQYYTPQGADWSRWTTASGGLTSLSQADASAAMWQQRIKAGGYGLIVIFYPSPFATVPVTRQLLIDDAATPAGQRLLKLSGAAAGEPGIAAATVALQSDHTYSLVATGPYNSRSSSGIYAIWRKEQR